ncbi:manganese/zinc/iron transport system permease protein [Trueperella bonasi]|uniref:Manganese/zinc/iron transport system permease protein n=1 Tax=Trueperella bonasi TaxID=312286 RepID=A0ABT9NFJ1_9ACTO|nr:metal ABC transporter permease [Trueperella bonasi]MDP9805977.1 manganese/zinc/iron transport system permease protein [Trueperella bonasi]
MDWISPLDFLSVYGFRTTFFTSALVGLLAGSFGSLLYMRRQSLLSDVMGHASLAGVVGGFAVAAGIFGANGQSIAVLIAGAAISSYLAVFLVQWITERTVIGADAAMAISLSLFYGGGLSALHVLNHSSIPGKAGLSDYIFGNAATTRASDGHTIAAIALVLGLVLCAGWKEIKVAIFDPQSAELYGFKLKVINPVLTTCITVAIVSGVKAVGLILMVAFAIIPGAAMHQWARSLGQLVIGSGIIGLLAGAVGAYVSINLGRVPTGPVVVVVLFAVFVVALCTSRRPRHTGARR